jgi:hypothetical protein
MIEKLPPDILFEKVIDQIDPFPPLFLFFQEP